MPLVCIDVSFLVSVLALGVQVYVMHQSLACSCHEGSCRKLLHMVLTVRHVSLDMVKGPRNLCCHTEIT